LGVAARLALEDAQEDTGAKSERVARKAGAKIA
jgi:hypothetical protein